MSVFDEPGDPSPLTEMVALARLEKSVEPVARFIMYGATALILPLHIFDKLPLVPFMAIVGLIWYTAWVIVFRHWRSWAIGGGCDPEALKLVGEEVGILPAKGSFWWYFQWPAHAP
jgi:hypothetical protein